MEEPKEASLLDWLKLLSPFIVGFLVYGYMSGLDLFSLGLDGK
ncbi:MAG: hypothetical protein Q8R86_09670 [Sulfuricurvum sp.]|nr:hypothetical protein [Sulfuricurvum sp.]